MTSSHAARPPVHTFRWWTSLLLMMISVAGAPAQNSLRPSSLPLSDPKHSLMLSFGVGALHSRNGIMSFWEMGPGGSVTFMINVKRELAFGMGLDIAHVSFRDAAFRSTFPGIPVRQKNITMGALSLAMTYSTLPTMRFSPFVGATLGATRLSKAVYRQTVDSVRVTYYNIPGRARLTVGLTAGADIVLVRWLALRIEMKTIYIHNDPDLGFASFFRAGVRLAL